MLESAPAKSARFHPFAAMSSRPVFPLIPTLVVVAVLITMINLGMWQLRRFDEKNALLANYQTRLQETPVALATLSTEQTQQFQRVSVSGHFQASPQWLVANQIQQQQLGFLVLSVFVQDNGQRVIVNRGFVAANIDPNALPDISLDEIPITISGHLFSPSKPWRSPDVLPQQAGVNVLPVLDWEKLRNSLGSENIFSMMLRLDEDAVYGYRRDWQIIAGIPEKHRAYAVQWFAMSAALIAIYGLYLSKRQKRKDKAHEQHT